MATGVTGTLIESPAERDARIRREAIVIAQSRVDIEVGRGIGFEALEAWLDDLDRDGNAPPPTGAATR